MRRTIGVLHRKCSKIKLLCYLVSRTQSNGTLTRIFLQGFFAFKNLFSKKAGPRSDWAHLNIENIQIKFFSLARFNESNENNFLCQNFFKLLIYKHMADHWLLDNAVLLHQREATYARLAKLWYLPTNDWIFEVQVQKNLNVIVKYWIVVSTRLTDVHLYFARTTQKIAALNSTF